MRSPQENGYGAPMPSSNLIDSTNDVRDGQLRLLRGDVPNERGEWLALLDRNRNIEAFAHPAYLDLFAGAGEVPACIVFRDAQNQVLHPVLLRSLEAQIELPGELAGAMDICAPPYGWGGPFVSGERSREEAVGSFYAALGNWAREARVVTDYHTFCPLDSVAGYPGEVAEKLPIVVRSLDLDDKALARDYRPKVRKNVKRARASGLVAEIDESGAHLDAFLDIYYSTMDRREAAGRYYFPRPFFEAIAAELKGRYVFVHVRKSGAIVSTELALVSHRSVYSFMGGTDASAYPERPNDLLKDELIRWSRHRGAEVVVLGGGVSGTDGIFRYKRSFAPSGVRPLKVGRWVIDPIAYDALVRQRERCGPIASPAFFPAYRAP